MHVLDFGGDLVDARGVHAKALVAGQGLAGKLEKNTLEDGFGHQSQYRIPKLQGWRSSAAPGCAVRNPGSSLPITCAGIHPRLKRAFLASNLQQRGIKLHK